MLGDRKGTHFTTRDLKSIGFYFCDTLLDYCDPDPTKVELKQIKYFSLQDTKTSVLSVSFFFFQLTYCLTELAVMMRKRVREKLGRDFGSEVTASDLETR